MKCYARVIVANIYRLWLEPDFFLHRENKSNEHLGNSVLLRLIII